MLPRRYAGCKHLGVAPDLRLGDAAVGLEDADDLPRFWPQLHRRADGQPGELRDAARPTMISFVPGLNIRPFDDLDAWPDLQRPASRREAARWRRSPIA